jgi:inosose dehydratase
MTLSIASAPGAWGIEPPVSPRYPPWTRVLDEIAEAGFNGCELGPIGYLPRGQELIQALASRGLKMPAAFVMEPLSAPDAFHRTVALARETCGVLESVGAKTLILIDGLHPSRSATAGRSEDAARLDLSLWEQLMTTAQAICQVAAEHGLSIAFHPHAGTNVEFEDEIDRLMSDLDSPNAGICIDTGHAVFAGIDPARLARRYASRLVHVHLKDVDDAVLQRCLAGSASFEQAVASGVFTPLGGGSIDLEDFADALRAAGYEGWATFEQDRLVERIGDALDDARRSLQHARSIGL